MTTHRVLLIDDDERLYDLLKTYLSDNDIAIDHASDGGRGLVSLSKVHYDAVLLDVMMPGMDGLETLRRLRQKWDTPVIMLTAKGDEADREVGLDQAADDFVPKPFRPRELLARLRARFRRTGGAQATEALRAGSLSIDLGRREARIGEATIELTGLQFDLLTVLVRRVGRVVSRDQLLSDAGRDDVMVGARTVDVHISQLRKRLAAASSEGEGEAVIHTERGVGYVLKSSASAHGAAT